MQQVNLFNEEIVTTKLIDRDLLASVLVQSLKGISSEELVSILYSKFEAIIDFAELCKGSNSGQKISMLFNPHRYDTKTVNAPSIIESFKNEKFLDGLARAVLFKYGTVNELLYQVLQLGINGTQYVNEFPPYKAQQIYKQYSAKSILDPCAGWGGRMIGAASIGAFYHGFEPSTKTYNGLLQLGEFLKSFGNGFDYKIECMPFEDVHMIPMEYDISFTSPPYYDTEIYSDEITNSCNRYETFNKWCESFYVPMVRKSCECANIVIMNIGCRKYPLTEVLINEGFNLVDIGKRLSGISGLGKRSEGAESFYEIKFKSS